MANPLNFKPQAVDPKQELNRRLAAAPEEHAEALLVLWDLLEAAHREGVLDMMHGAVTARDTIFGELAKYANTQEAVNAIRNFVALTKIFAALDPDMLDRLSRGLIEGSKEFEHEPEPPSLFQLAKRANDADSRRGLSFLTLALSSFGRSLKR